MRPSSRAVHRTQVTPAPAPVTRPVAPRQESLAQSQVSPVSAGIERLRSMVGGLFEDRGALVRSFAQGYLALLKCEYSSAHALGTLAEAETSRDFKKAILAIRDEILGGSSLPQAFEKGVPYFNPLFRQLIKAGDEGYCLKEMLAFASQNEAATEGGKNASLNLVEFSYVCGTLLKNDVGSLAALRLASACVKGPLGEALTDVANQIRVGTSFTEAVKSHQKLFDPLFISMVKTAEHRGMFNEILVAYAQSRGLEVKV